MPSLIRPAPPHPIPPRPAWIHWCIFGVSNKLMAKRRFECIRETCTRHICTRHRETPSMWARAWVRNSEAVGFVIRIFFVASLTFVKTRATWKLTCLHCLMTFPECPCLELYTYTVHTCSRAWLSESPAKHSFILLFGIPITVIVNVQEYIAWKGDKWSVHFCPILILAGDIDSISMHLCEACIASVEKNTLLCHILEKNEELTHTSEIFTRSEPSPALNLICTRVSSIHLLL